MTTAGGYARPTQAADGTIIAGKDKLLHRLDRSGRLLNTAGDPQNCCITLLTPHLSPDDQRVVYNLSTTAPLSPARGSRRRTRRGPLPATKSTSRSAVTSIRPGSTTAVPSSSRGIHRTPRSGRSRVTLRTGSPTMPSRSVVERSTLRAPASPRPRTAPRRSACTRFRDHRRPFPPPPATSPAPTDHSFGPPGPRMAVNWPGRRTTGSGQPVSASRAGS